MRAVVRTDLHQHVFGETLLRALEARAAAPSARFEHGSWWLQGPADEPWRVPRGAGDEAVLVATLPADGIDRALIAPSLPLGLDVLPADEAHVVLDAHHADVRALDPARFGAWAAVPLRERDLAAVARARLAEGFAGIAVPAGALATPAALDRLGPLLEVLERHERPLLVHPGAPRAAPAEGHAWWTPVVDYVGEQHAAWHAWAAAGRRAHPRLRVVFALLAGLAPLHHERAAARGGPSAAAADPLTFYDTSSYGPQAVAAMAAAVGLPQLVHGSDRPMATPAPLGLSPADQLALLTTNPARVLG